MTSRFGNFLHSEFLQWQHSGCSFQDVQYLTWVGCFFSNSVLINCAVSRALPAFHVHHLKTPRWFGKTFKVLEGLILHSGFNVFGVWTSATSLVGSSPTVVSNSKNFVGLQQLKIIRWNIFTLGVGFTLQFFHGIKKGDFIRFSALIDVELLEFTNSEKGYQSIIFQIVFLETWTSFLGRF